ncbi:hypothetical protein [Chitinophaga nivalis]|uniref:CdiI immunity protein domain-containing protein n=1 Tax=Chitinophaga nivalis TaxID=2991709 RepID=A0ABT3IES5_9BACT|nr:hypothetical protein [Chitinophaga nivalis]MCW3467849.1 hypothetical protein [Chitinophaga nivalis]MCW3482459.1 hypothetical protein [Chitinophaga nivalis]
MKAPPPRYITGTAIATLAQAFGYPNHPHMQDWEYEVSSFADLEKYMAAYVSTADDDIRFLLMEMILETSNNKDRDFDWIAAIWPRVKALLTACFPLHAPTVYYWSCFDVEDIADTFYISAAMRELWLEQTDHAAQSNPQ